LKLDGVRLKDNRRQKVVETSERSEKRQREGRDDGVREVSEQEEKERRVTRQWEDIPLGR